MQSLDTVTSLIVTPYICLQANSLALLNIVDSTMKGKEHIAMDHTVPQRKYLAC